MDIQYVYVYIYIYICVCNNSYNYIIITIVMFPENSTKIIYMYNNWLVTIQRIKTLYCKSSNFPKKVSSV